MITAEVGLALIGSLLFKSAISASINYEPIKITVNENFITKPGQVSTEIRALEPGVLHQGANFYFKPQLNLPQNFIPSHIEALISLIQQHHHSCAKDASKVVVDKDKLIEMLQPFMYPLSENSKERLLENVLEKENTLNIVKPPQIIEKMVTEPLPVIITEEPKHVTPEPIGPVIPQFLFNDIPGLIEKQVKKKDSVKLEEPEGEYLTIPEIVVRPITKPLINNVEPKLMTIEFANIPETPILPPFSFDGIPPKVKEEIRKEETEIVEEKGVFPAIPEIALRPIQESIINYVEPEPGMTSNSVTFTEAPALPPVSANDIKLIEDGAKFNEPIVVDVKKPAIQEYVVISEAPVLPPLAVHDIPSIVEKEVKKEEFVIFEDATRDFSTFPEIAVRPIQEPIINYVEPELTTSDLLAIPEAPVLPKLLANDIHVLEDVKIEEPIAVDVEPNPIIQELVIPEAPILPPLSLKSITSIFEEKLKKEESIKFDEQASVVSTIPELVEKPIEEPLMNYVEPKPIITEFQVFSEAPALPPLSANEIKLIEDGAKFNEPIVVDVKKPAIQEYVVISEAPVLPPLAVHDIPPSIVEKEVTKEEFVIFVDATRDFSTFPEIAVRPIQEPIINYVEPELTTSNLLAIPEARVLPKLLANDIHVLEDVKIEEPIAVDVKPNPIIQELVIPEATILPPLSLKSITSIFEEKLKKEKSIIVGEQASVVSTIPELVEKPIEEPLMNYVEPKPIITEFQVFSEAPALPPLSANEIKLIEDEAKFNEPIVVDVKKPAIQEYVVISEAPVLPPLAVHDIPSIVEKEVKKEEFVIFEDATRDFSKFPEIAVGPIQEPIINYVEPELATSDLLVIPEAQVLPTLSANDIHVLEEVKIEEPIVGDVEPNPIIQELVIPEAPILPPLSLKSITSIFEEKLKKEESIMFDEQASVVSTIPELVEKPIEEPLMNYVEPKPIITEFQVFSEAPALPPVSANEIKLIEDGEKFNEPIVVDVKKPAIQEYVVISEAPVLPPLAVHDIPPSIVEKEVTKEEFVIFVDATRDFSTFPEIAVRPIQEPIINYVEPELTTSDLLAIPEARVLPKLLANDIHVLEDVKIEEPIAVDVKPNPIIQELVIPEAPILPPLSLKSIPSFFEENLKKKESIIFEETTAVLPTIPEILVRPIEEPKINYVMGETTTADVLVIPEAPVITTLLENDIHVFEEVKIKEPIIVDVKPNPVIHELAIPEAPILPALSLKSIPSFFEENLEKEESVIFKEPTGLLSTIPEIVVRPIEEPTSNYDKQEPTTADVIVIPDPPVLPPLSPNDIHVVEEVKIEEPIVFGVESATTTQEIVTSEAPILPPLSFIPSVIEDEVKKEESSIFDAETGELPSIPETSSRPIPEPIIVSETAESFALENNVFPVVKEEVKIEIPILLEEMIDFFPPIAEISSGESIQEPEMTNANVLEEVSQPNLERVVTDKETLPPTIIPKPSNNLGVFSYAPFVSHLSNCAPKTNKLSIAKPASLERFLLKKHPFRLPVMPFPKLFPIKMKAPIWENKKQFLYPTSYAHDVVEKRIAPNMAFKKNAPPKRVKIYIRSQVPKEPSYL